MHSMQTKHLTESRKYRVEAGVTYVHFLAVVCFCLTGYIFLKRKKIKKWKTTRFQVYLKL